MPAHNPEELDVLFAQAINAGNIETVIQLYEPAASLTPQPGQEAPAFLREYPSVAGALVSCAGVTKLFGGFTAVDRVDLELQDRRLHALIGPNGAGKTTLFNLISGMFAPDRGQVKLVDRQIGGLPPEAVAAQGLSRSFQITSLFPSLSVGEHLRLGVQARSHLRLHPLIHAQSLEPVNAQTRELVKFLGLEGVEGVTVADLSYGGQRLVEIGVALAGRPRALLLDEPLVGLAAAEREAITALIRGLTQHMAVLLVEHDIDRVFAIADKITVMNRQGAGRGRLETVAATPRCSASTSAADTLRRRALRGPSCGRQAAAGAVRDQYSTWQEPYPARRELRVRENEVVALLGRNGAGKSSTFKASWASQPRAPARRL
jgi:ABC-type branched-subunit amino acid transport system ATPase component